MSFIYGIINKNGEQVSKDQIEKLADAVAFENFQIKYTISNNCAFGYCFRKDRVNKASIFESDDVLIVSDTFIYDYSLTFGSYIMSAEDIAKMYLDHNTKMSAEDIAKMYLDHNTKKSAEDFAKMSIDQKVESDSVKNCKINTEQIIKQEFEQFQYNPDLEWVKYLEGEYAIVIFDKRRHETILIKDHMGYRPLCYYFNKADSSIVFASHPLGIKKSNILNLKLNRNKLLNSFLPIIAGNYELTYFEYVKNVLPSYYVKISGNKLLKNRYWLNNHISIDPSIDENNAITKIRELLVKAVSVRIENGKIGSHFSGGLDSSGVAALLIDLTDGKPILSNVSNLSADNSSAKDKSFGNDSSSTKDKSSAIEHVYAQRPIENNQNFRKRIELFSWSPLEDDYATFLTKKLPKSFQDRAQEILMLKQNHLNEIELIRQAGEEKNINVNFTKIKSKEIEKYIKNVQTIETVSIYHFEELCLSEAQKMGVVQIFSGWGGDECVSMSNRGAYHNLFWGFRYKKIYKLCKDYGFTRTSVRILLEITPSLFKLFNTKNSFNILKFFKPKHKINAFFRLIKLSLKQYFGYGNRKKFITNLLNIYHLQERIDSWALLGEKYGVSYKYPLLDKKLIEYYLSLPDDLTYNFNNSRKLYRDALENILPDSIRLRKDKSDLNLRNSMSLLKMLTISDILQNNKISSENNLRSLVNPDTHHHHPSPPSPKSIRNNIYAIDEIVDKDLVLKVINNPAIRLSDYIDYCNFCINYMRYKNLENTFDKK